MAKDLITRGIKKPHHIPHFLLSKLRHFYLFRMRKGDRVSFSYSQVAGSRLPALHSRLYKEVKLFQEALDIIDTKVVRSLEIGCGYGRLTPWIMEKSYEHYAIEPELKLLNVAKKLYPEAHFYKASAQELPFPDRYFDLIVVWTVLQHIPSREFLKAVCEIKRVARPTAVILLAEATREEKSSDRFFCLWPRSRAKYEESFYPWVLTWSRERG